MPQILDLAQGLNQALPDQGVVFDAIRKELPDVIMIPSTGGATGMSPEERLQPTELFPEMATLDCGTCNFGDEIFDNTMPTMRAFGKRMIENGIKPEYECFELGHIDTVLGMAKKGEVPGDPMQFNFVLAVHGCTPATVENLAFFASKIPAGSTWTVSGVGRAAWTMAAAAIAMGGNVRVGFEDNIYLGKGQKAASNGELVAKVVRIAKELGREIFLGKSIMLLLGGLVIGAASTVMLWFQGGKTQTTFERIIIVMLLIITFGFIAGLFVDPPSPGEVVKGMIPRFQGTDSVLMAASILGATVMPHAIYLHSTLVNDHYYTHSDKPSIAMQLKGSKIDVTWALLLAGTVNLAMLVLAANSLHGMSGTDSIDGAQRAITQVLGPVIGTIFSIGLLASSLSSTSVGTYAGSEIMHGLLHVNAPMWACRVVTLVPALIVLWFAKDPTQALVIGQVVLSIGIPFAVIPLMRYTHNKELMGKWADGTVKHVIFMIVVALIVALNVLLIVLTLMGRA